MLRITTAFTLAFFYAAAAVASGNATPAPDAKAPLAKGAEKPAAKPFVYRPRDGDTAFGKDTAPVVIVEYASLSCPHCAHFYLNSLPVLTTKYIDTGKVKLVYRNFPLNDPALKGAELVQCADPDRRHAYLKVLFSTQMKWAYDTNYRDALSNIAALGGMDRLKFEACMNDKSVQRKVLATAKEAQDDYKIDSTPTFFVNGTLYKGDHDPDSMGKVIDEALKAAPAK